jgi:hypothetical protein
MSVTMCVTTSHVCPGISATRGRVLTRSRAVVERNPILRIEKTLQHCRFQFQKGAQQFVRMNNVAATFAMGDYDPTPSATEYLGRKFELALGCRLVGFSRIRPTTDRRSAMQASAHGKARYFLRSICLTPLRSGTPCCSSKHDSKLFRSTGTLGCAPFGAALRYCTGHAIG